MKKITARNICKLYRESTPAQRGGIFCRQGNANVKKYRTRSPREKSVRGLDTMTID